MKLALAIITRDTKEDAVLLERLLNNLKPHVDGIFLTTETKEGVIAPLAKKFKAHLSEFKWINDFSAARNFNFSQVPEEYDYIMWSDIDDVWRGFETVKLGEKDAYAFWYLYDFDEDKQPIVAHKKVMIVKNDGSFKWYGKVHEDLLADRDVSMEFIETAERMHFTNEVRIDEARERNLLIAEKSYEEDKDPRNLFNLANALSGAGKFKEAKERLLQFLKESNSNEEKYLARQRIATIEFNLGNMESAYEHLYICCGLEPKAPDAFLQLGQLFFDAGRIEDCIKYLLHGLVLKPQYKSMVVFNPRDYDYNPMHLLAKAYFRQGRPDIALQWIKGCLQVNPNPRLKEMADALEKESNKLKKITDLIKELELLPKDELKKKLDALSDEEKAHPGICKLRNANFFKEESSGKDITYYCGYTEHEWNPELFKVKGYGGSEEAVIHLTRRWAKEGFNVTVYANIGSKEIVSDGVTWKPFWSFNSKDATDYLILWRSPRLCDYDLNAKNVYIDVHDVIQRGEFTKQRLDKISKIFFKTKFHRDLYQVPEEKVEIVPNGVDVSAFSGEFIKEPFSIINTSSPDRSMEAVIKVFEKVKQKVPEAKLYWAYGWDIFDKAHEGDKAMMDWKDRLIKEMDRVGITQLGKIPQDKIVNLYAKGSIFLYPTEFAEIHCISAVKAQLAGCQMITTDFAALNETVGSGVKIHSQKTSENWSMPYQRSFAVEDPEMIDKFVEETVKALQAPRLNIEGIEYAKKYDWDLIIKQWKLKKN